jgi:S-formylglutathione hydrolase FrmB
MLAILLGAAAVNARYAYLPTLGSVLGRRAVDQVSTATLRTLEHPPGRAPGLARAPGRVRLALAHRQPERPLAARRRGVVVPFVIPATHSHFRARTAEVYLPPAYFDAPRPHLPVIELLHGTPGSPADWTRGGLADVTADAYAASHHGVAPLLVMPDINGSWDADSECVNGSRGQMQTYLTVDVQNAVIARFATQRDAKGWAIAGLSEGGYCALQIGLRNPTLYSAIGDFSGEAGPEVTGGIRRLFAGTLRQAQDQAARYDPVDLLRAWHGADRPAIWFEVGSEDGALPTVVGLDELARARGFETRLVVQPGFDHSFVAWRDAFRDALPWLEGAPTAAPIPVTARE